VLALGREIARSIAHRVICIDVVARILKPVNEISPQENTTVTTWTSACEGRRLELLVYKPSFRKVV
jgi:hypothetical protein